MLLRKRVSFFPLPLRPILDKNRDPFFLFLFFFFNHISFLLSQARFSQLNAAWLIRPFLHSSCPTKRSFQPSSLSLSALFTSTTFTATHDQNVREKKKNKKNNTPATSPPRWYTKKEIKKWRQIFQTINPILLLNQLCIKREVRCDYSTPTCSFELLEDPPTWNFTYTALSLIWSLIQDFTSTFYIHACR